MFPIRRFSRSWSLRVLISVLVGLPLAAVEPGATGDRYWPQWRGPQANGVAPKANPPLAWSEDTNVRWKVKLPGRGLSTPVIWGDRLYVTTAVAVAPAAKPEQAADEPATEGAGGMPRGVAPDQVLEFTVLALDRATGKEVWRKVVRRATPHEGTHTDGSWASHSPATDGTILVVHFGSHGTYGLDLDGKLLWETDLGDMATRNGFGEGSSPVIHGDRVFVNWDHEGPSFFAALEKKTGKILWKVDRDEPTSWSTPLVVEHGGRTQVVVSATTRTRGYDVTTGNVIWEASGMTTNAIPSPVHATGRVIVMSGFRGNALQAIALDAARGDISQSPVIVWRHDQDTPYVPSPLLYGNQLYFLKHNQGILTSFDAQSGKEIYARQRLEGLEGVYASPVGAAGRVYVTGRGGTTLVLKHGPEFEVLASNKLDDGFDASIAIAGDELYLRGREHLYCVAEPPAKPAG